MKKSKLYTRTGDKGMTSLVDGSRIKKDSTRIEAYGTIDELNSFIGMLIASQPLTEVDCASLTDIQSRLFDIGSYLAAGNKEMSVRLLPQLDESLQNIENTIDLYDSEVPELRSFILPQGAPSAAAAHVARAVARRAERCILNFNDELHANAESDTALTEVHESILQYINRLSDYLFILSRHCNQLAGINDICWAPTKSRK